MELIDHIFVSHFLVTGTRIGEVTTVTAPQRMPSIDDDPNARVGKPGSDHAALPPRSARRNTAGRRRGRITYLETRTSRFRSS